MNVPSFSNCSSALSVSSVLLSAFHPLNALRSRAIITLHCVACLNHHPIASSALCPPPPQKARGHLQQLFPPIRSSYCSTLDSTPTHSLSGRFSKEHPTNTDQTKCFYNLIVCWHPKKCSAYTIIVFKWQDERNINLAL